MKIATLVAGAALVGLGAQGGFSNTPDLYKPPRSDKASHLMRAEAKRARKAAKRTAIYAAQAAKVSA